MSETESLSLKWGTLKGWNLRTERSKAALKAYFDSGVRVSAMSRDTPTQKELVCALIDVVNAEMIHLEWDDKMVTKEEAKAYVRGYR